MRTIGVDIDQDLVFEGQNTYGRFASPHPTILVATALSVGPDSVSVPHADDLYQAKLVFREDTFDAVTRLRRGRFYERGEGSQPQHWQVRDPTHVFTGSPFSVRLYGFRAWPALNNLHIGVTPSIVALGARTAFSVWRVIDVERTATGEDLVTLKARGSMGLLPELDMSVVPADARSRWSKFLMHLRTPRTRPHQLQLLISLATLLSGAREYLPAPSLATSNGG